MKKIKFFIFIILTLSITYYLIPTDFEKTPPIVYYNANIITLDSANNTFNTMYVANGKIIEIGNKDDVFSRVPKHVEKINLDGKTILPGFIDPHTHFALSMFLYDFYDLSGFKHKNNNEVWSYFKKVVHKTPKNEWIICKGIDPALIENLKVPNIKILDSIAPNNPVVMFSQSLHSYWANSKAFEKAGITKDTPNPSEHSYYQKDSLNNLTGLIAEQEAFKPFIELIKKEVLTSTALTNASTKVMKEYLKNGNTTIVSTGLTINDKKPLLLLQHLSDKSTTFLSSLLEKLNFLPERTQMPRHFIYMRNDMPHLIPETKTVNNDFYNTIGVKLWYDGSPYIGSMYLEEPYLENTFTNNTLHIPERTKGKALIEKQKLKELIKEHHNKGWQLAIHTQGDQAIKDVVDTFYELKNDLDFSSSRHRLEHCLLLPDTTLNKVKELNITPSFHINHLYYYGDVLDTKILGSERTQKILPVNTAIKKGVISSLHADQPMFESNPFKLIATAIKRETKTGKVIGIKEKIDIITALKALTINAAYQINMEDKIGSLEKGKYADFIILDKNPLQVSTDKLDKIKCTATYVNGNKVVF
ncbi:amidohydrolase [Tenacibaculum amylolyticum]|uniref:amidohydrolase n=1 Tax=Tenacibaculum amylolyticum TaxID=104269 RepID=UPI003894ECEC